mgnify:CR=1 FL=1
MRTPSCSAIFLMLLTALAHGQSADIRDAWMELEIYQDTWEDGPGYPGPYVSDNSWGEGFDTCSLVDWWSQPGSIRLANVAQMALDLSYMPFKLESEHMTESYCFGTVGWLESTVLELMIPTDWDWIQWGVIDWDASTPEGTSVMFQMRAGMSPDDLGAWTGYITTPGTGLEDLLSGEVMYAQYRVTLVSNDPDTTPVLEQMMVSYTPMGGVAPGSNRGISRPGLYVNGVNPSRGGGSLRCVLAASASMTLRVWDLSGRLVSRPAYESDLGAGEHVFGTGPLPPGTYVCRMTAGGEDHTARLVVIP